MTLQQLKARLDHLSPAGVKFVARVVDALSDPPRPGVLESGTWITESGDWMEYFSLALSLHHGTTREPLQLTSFETVFRNACESVGWSLDPPGSPTRRFVDLEVTPDDGLPRRLSLKSTAARNLSKNSAHISKLTEAAWIQDVRKAKERKERLTHLFEDYRAAVDAIVMLRAFRTGNEIPRRYELLEIPTAIFESIADLSTEHFSSDAPVLPCFVNKEEVARIATDRSDAKITVRGIRIDACVRHAEWTTEPAEAASR